MTGYASDIVLCCCRDERDVVETFIMFYLVMGFDAVYMVDNGSTDGTAQILEAVEASDRRVRVRRDARIGYERHLGEQYAWAGSIGAPRWIFFLDCDEFIWFPNGVKPFLEAIDPSVGCLRMRQRQMYPRLEPSAELGAFLLTERCSLNFDDTTKDVTRYHPRARLYAGKHRIDVPGARVPAPDPVYIRHYKYRSPEQARTKERNRVQSHESYGAGELKELSAFGGDVLPKWIEYCRGFERTEGWWQYFSPSFPAGEDPLLAAWASRELLPALATGGVRKAHFR